MTDEKDPKDQPETEAEAAARSAGDELKEGLLHLFTAARKVIKTAEPHVTRSLDDAERVIGKIGRGGEVVANEVGKEVATLATKLAERLRSMANRAEGNVPDERTPPAGTPSLEHKDHEGDKDGEKR